MRIGIMGAGAIGKEVARAARRMEGVTAIAAYDVRPEAVDALQADVADLRQAKTLDELIEVSDIVVEAASIEAATEAVPRILEAGCDVLMMSLGACADAAFYERLRGLARAHTARLWLPSGAIGGIDGLRAAKVGGVKSVTLVTTKPPSALGVDVDKWTIVYSGPAIEAIAKYPKNVNVALALSLAGVGADRTWVQVVADPLARHNQHKVIVEGTFGRMRIEVDNLPHPENPKTSHLASLSAIATLERMIDPIQLGN